MRASRSATRRFLTGLTATTATVLLAACDPASSGLSDPLTAAPQIASQPPPPPPAPAGEPDTSAPGSAPSGAPTDPAPPTTTTTAPAETGGGTIFGWNDGSGYDSSYAFNQEVSLDAARFGLTIARMGADGIGCEQEGTPCDFTNRDEAVRAHVEQGIDIHMTVAFRSQLDWAGGDVDQWARNYGWKCGQLADRYQEDVRYYIVDNEVDLSYGDGPQARQPAGVAVRMQKACYDAIKAVDPGILVESTPASSPETGYNRELLEAGVADSSDVQGTHMYGGQIDRNAIATLRGYMAEFGVDQPVACSECGASPEWYEPGEGNESFNGLYGTEARAAWLREFAAYARANDLHNVLFFSWKSVHGSWEMNGDPLAEAALDDIGHGRF